MSKVNILSPDIISKIAAGEVIERPASVIKELVENSIDAGATSIEVYLKEAGKTFIQVKDNGSGIEQDDLDKIFLRHSTSKISSADDLYAIHSLGFRGEALYSVASIADILVQSKTNNQDSGWEIHCRGGEQINLKPCTYANSGTDITIHELFYNMPARKKFLKSNISEMNQVLNNFIPYTLLHKNIRFQLSHQGKTLLDVSPSSNCVDRIIDVLHLDGNHIMETEHIFADKQYKVHMVLGDINIKRNRRDYQFIFVNGRPVQSKNMSYHMNQIYRLILPPERFPFFILFLVIPPECVDVNIHPTKREVKIKDEQNLCSILRSMCEHTLMKSGQGKQVHEVAPNIQNDSVQKAFIGTHISEKTFETTGPSETFDSPGRGTPSEKSIRDYAYPRQSFGGKQKEFYIPDDKLFAQKQDSLHHKLTNAHYIGAFIHKYLLFESHKSLLLVDQHAAQERIMYEHLIKQMEKGTVEVQHLLSPILIKVTTQEMITWEDSQEEFEKPGLSTNLFDEETIAVHTHPVLIKDVEKAVRDILSGDEIKSGDHEALARRACRSSIMTGDRLHSKQAEYQREQLLACLDPFTCPHGRPTVIEMSESFLDKQFLRT